jgi:hypothetical protein
MPQDMSPATEPKAISHDTPLRAVRRHCLACCNGSAVEVRQCADAACPLWVYRFGKRPVHPMERRMAGTSGLRSIRKRCVDCSGLNDVEVRSCKFGPDHAAPCSLHPFRLGTNPFLAPRSPEWQQAATERLASFNRPALPKLPSQNPMSASAQALDEEQPPKMVAGANSLSGPALAG